MLSPTSPDSLCFRRKKRMMRNLISKISKFQLENHNTSFELRRRL